MVFSISDDSVSVSIHAPLRREERRCCWTRSIRVVWFQSTPPSGERSDLLTCQHGRRGLVSIHAPLRREERRATD